MPKSIEDLKQLDQTIAELEKREPTALVVLFCSLYILKQTFAIPGSLILNILAGRVFGTSLGFFTTTVVRYES